MIEKGTKVVCINDTFEPWVLAIYAELPKKGEIYTIRDIDIGVNVKSIESNPDSSLLFTGSHNIMVLLEELVNPDMPISKKEMGFGAWRFAPIQTWEAHTEENISVQQPKVIEFPTPQPKRELEIAA